MSPQYGFMLVLLACECLPEESSLGVKCTGALLPHLFLNRHNKSAARFEKDSALLKGLFENHGTAFRYMSILIISHKKQTYKHIYEHM
jgi:hypothetical protein